MSVTLTPASFPEQQIYTSFSNCMRNGKPTYPIHSVVVGGPVTGNDGRNAMVIPVPAKAGTFRKTNFLPLPPTFLYAAGKRVQIAETGERTLERGPIPRDYKPGFYQTSFAQDPQGLLSVLEGFVPCGNLDSVPTYARLYSGWTFVVLGFEGNCSMPSPVGFYYEPAFPGALFVPGLSAILDGRPIYSEVDGDLELILGLRTSDAEPHLIKTNFRQTRKNGDYAVPRQRLIEYFEGRSQRRAGQGRIPPVPELLDSEHMLTISP